MSQEQLSITPAEARRALEAVGQRSRAVRAGQRDWPSLCLAAYGTAILVVFPMIGLLGRAGVLAAMGLWVVLVSVTVSFAARQHVTAVGRIRVIGTSFAAWAAVYGGALFTGEFAFPGRLSFWLPATLLVAAPLFVGAWWAQRR